MKEWKLGEVCAHGEFGFQCWMCVLSDENSRLELELEAARKVVEAARVFFSSHYARAGDSERGADAVLFRALREYDKAKP